MARDKTDYRWQVANPDNPQISGAVGDYGFFVRVKVNQGAWNKSCTGHKKQCNRDTQKIHHPNGPLRIPAILCAPELGDENGCA